MSAAWDRAAALERVAGDQVLLAELITIFLEDYPGQLAALHQSLEQGDSDALRKAAHTLKGSLSYLAASPGAQLALAIEHAVLEANPAQVRELVSQLAAYVDFVRPLMVSLGEQPTDAGDC